MSLPWLAHDEAPVRYITIPQYRFNKTKQHKSVTLAGGRCNEGLHHDITGGLCLEDCLHALQHLLSLSYTLLSFSTRSLIFREEDCVLVQHIHYATFEYLVVNVFANALPVWDCRTKSSQRHNYGCSTLW